MSMFTLDENGVPDADMLRFSFQPIETGFGVVEKYEAGWRGEWPPPEKLGIAVGTESGMVTVFDAEDEAVPKTLEAAPSIIYFLCDRRDHSKLTERMPHVMRCAEYVQAATIPLKAENGEKTA